MFFKFGKNHIKKKKKSPISKKKERKRRRKKEVTYHMEILFQQINL